jgi:hypothetical protein
MSPDESVSKAVELYPDLVAINSEGGLTPLVYKLDTALVASYLIKMFIEADFSAQSLLMEYEQAKPNMSGHQKEELWDNFRIANQVAAILKEIIDNSKHVILSLPESIKNDSDTLQEYLEGSRDPEGLRSAITHWVEGRFREQ